MLKNRGVSFVIIALISVAALLVGNTMMESESEASYLEIEDGVYEGSSDAGMNPGLKVSVTIEGGKIMSVEIIEHDETPGISDPAIDGMPVSIVEANSPDVEVISGATYTSEAIKEAVSKAISGESDSEEPVEEPVEEQVEIEEVDIGAIADGVYEGSSDAGMNPGLKVSVTVEAGKIVSVEIIEHDETEGISDPALSGVPESIVAANSPNVEVVSGATYTSEAIIEAVVLALESGL